MSMEEYYMKKENEEIMVEIKLIDEDKYQQFKKNMRKTNDYFTVKEWKILMQFLMQRQNKTIKNEVKT